MDYSVQLMDSHFPQDQQRIIEQRYSVALAHHLGGSGQVVLAHRAWAKAKSRQDEVAAAEMSLQEKQAIQRWERADAASRLLALEGYTGALRDLCIQVKTHPVQEVA